MPTLAELNRVVEGEIRGDENVEIIGVASLESAGESDIAPLDSDRWIKVARKSKAGALLVSTKVEATFERPVIAAEYPLASLNRVMETLGLISPPPTPGIHPTAIFADSATLGENLHVGPYVVIGAAKIGNGCVFHPGAVVESGVEMGDGCVIGAGAVLREGSRLGDRVHVGPKTVLSGPGFGFASSASGPVPLHHIGTVVLEDDVHLGAGVTIDRARFDETRVGRLSALDNLVHVGHNSTIGQGSFIAAQTGLAGSARIGSGCEVGGQVGIANNAGIGDGCRVGAQTGITRFFEGPIEIWGTPAQPKFCFDFMPETKETALDALERFAQEVRPKLD